MKEVAKQNCALFCPRTRRLLCVGSSFAASGFRLDRGRLRIETVFHVPDWWPRQNASFYRRDWRASWWVKTPVILPQFHALIEVRMHSIVPILYRRPGVFRERRKLSLPRYL